MTQLEITLAWIILQVTLALPPAVVLHFLASRRGPASGSWTAASSLVMVIAITVIALVPRPPSWDRVQARDAARVASNDTPAAFLDVTDQGKQATPQEHAKSGFVPGLWMERVRSLLGNLQTRTDLPISPSVHWTRFLSFGLIAGVAISLCRLLAGVWAVRECRRRGRVIDDPDLVDRLNGLQHAMGICRAIDVLELPHLATAATAGWRRPVILLPEDWRSWNENELGAVLAHELAHIARADYAVGLVSRLALALHFYHPVSRWMFGRLLLQQELAADALGAYFSGGRAVYLAVLSRMALRQEKASCWPARAFLPARGTLIRRIDMMKTNQEWGQRSWSATSRLATSLLLFCVAAAVWSLPGPARGSGGDKTSDPAKEAKPTARKEPANHPPAFDLSYIPDDEMGIIAFQPAAACGRQGMAKHALALNTLLAVDWPQIARGLGVPSPKCPLAVEEIEQVTASLGCRRVTIKGKEMRRIDFHCLMIRTVKPFDWVNLLRSCWPELIKAKEGSRTYYKLKPGSAPNLSKAPAFLIPDDRTVIFDDEDVLLRLIRRDSPAKPEFTRGADWKKVEHDLFAVVFDNHDGRLQRAVAKLKDVGEEDTVVEFLKLSREWIFGLEDADDFLVRMTVACHDQSAGATLAKMISNLRDNTVLQLEKAASQQHKGEDDGPLCRLGGQVMRGLRVAADGSSVRIEPGAGVKLADLLPLWLKNGM
jgi:hypothetical protein